MRSNLVSSGVSTVMGDTSGHNMETNTTNHQQEQHQVIFRDNSPRAEFDPEGESEVLSIIEAVR